MDLSRPPEKPLILLLVKRLTFFLFIMSLFLIFLYVIGTRQEFMDLTQVLLLRLLGGTGLFLAAGSLCGVVLNLRAALSGRAPGGRRGACIAGAAAYLLAGIFGAGAAAAALFITAAVAGNAR
jgi:hypothetical protein